MRINIFYGGDNMKKRLLLMIIVITIIFICGCSNEGLKLGKYVKFKNGFEYAWVELKENNEFEFNRSIATSYWPRGSYSIQDGELILKVRDEEEYKFKIDGEKIVFISGTHIGNLLDEGEVFQFSDKDE